MYFYFYAEKFFRLYLFRINEMLPALGKDVRLERTAPD